ncbi:hypothetical protein [uncultured Roseovarius sp.]|uniref:hypothetical protein n=1 Tax=uncultured Roseovarius sp. TaxID=293344 RepID=UPI00260B9709|nr:hypothetical protein [uncultured Roseovarius sp.]
MPGEGTSALRSVPLYGGDVVVEGPRGYCIDPTSLKRGLTGSFALLASCESLTGQVGVIVEPAVMTVSVLPARGAAQQPDAASMARALAPVEVRVAEDGDGISLVQVMQGGQEALPGGDPVHWRAGMVINGHLLGLAVYGPKGGGVSGRMGREMLRDLAEALREASPTAAVARQARPPRAKRKGVLGALFPVSN